MERNNKVSTSTSLFLSGITIFVHFSCGSLCAQQREPRLLDKATLAVKHKWQVVDGASFQWLSEHDLLYLPPTTQNGETVKCRDVRTGKERPLLALTKQIHDVEGKGELYREFLSPDCKWLLVLTRPEEGNAKKFHAFTLDGARHVEWDFSALEDTDDVHWMRDSRHWVAFQENRDGNYTDAFIGDIRAPKTLKHILLPPHTMVNVGSNIIGVQSEDILFSLPGTFNQHNRYQDRSISLYELSLYHSVKPQHTYVIYLPEGRRVKAASISPDGKQVAWLLRCTYKPPYTMLQPLPKESDLMPIFLSAPAVQARATDSVWISRLDGSKMREIGYIDVRLHDSDINVNAGELIMKDGTDEPFDLQWLPGNEYLSVFIDDKLYQFGTR